MARPERDHITKSNDVKTKLITKYKSTEIYNAATKDIQVAQFIKELSTHL